MLLHRRGLAAVTAAVAAYVGVMAATGPPPPTVSVWTAAHDLPSGTVLRPDDLARVRFTPASVPTSAVREAGPLLGRTLAVPLRRGQPLAADQVVADGWLAGRPGMTAVPVRLSDPGVAALLRPGDHVTLVAADPQHPTDATPLTAATVLSVPRGAGSSATGALPGRLVLVGVPAGDASRLVGAAAAAFLTVTWEG